MPGSVNQRGVGCFFVFGRLEGVEVALCLAGPPGPFLCYMVLHKFVFVRRGHNITWKSAWLGKRVRALYKDATAPPGVAMET